jgi:predicted alpha/beta-fold hydrolase
VSTICLALSLIAAPPSAMTTQFATSKDGTRIAYDVTGSGPTIVLLHGGGLERSSWHTGGYVARLAKEFRVVTMDIRGNGESDKPGAVEMYSFEKLNEDTLAVADAVNARRFTIWGFSYGANVGRYLASRSDRVVAMVYIGIPFGPAIGEMFMSYVQKMANRPAFISAMLAYPAVEPVEMRCPTLWIVGSRNEGAIDEASKYRDRLAGTKVTLEVIDGLNHPQEFDQIDRVFPSEVTFTKAHAR